MSGAAEVSFIFGGLAASFASDASHALHAAYFPDGPPPSCTVAQATLLAFCSVAQFCSVRPGAPTSCRSCAEAIGLPAAKLLLFEAALAKTCSQVGDLHCA